MTNLGISLVVATKDRPEDLRRLLESLLGQSVHPNEVVIVDASSEPVDWVLAEFPSLNTTYLRHFPPSAAAQRNEGIRACSNESTLVGVADDDTIFEEKAFEKMLQFWSDAAPDVLGAAFNIRNYPNRAKPLLKHSNLSERIGLYSAIPGSVSKSGWQTIIGELADTQFVDWLPSTAVVFRREVFDHHLFDEYFESYSYLEDLDFGYTLRRTGRLAVVAGAGYSHYPSPSGRVTAQQFGIFEVRNRLYFVRKHSLSLSRCYLCLMIRLAMSIRSGLFRRALGNFDELLRQMVIPLPKATKESHPS